MPPGNRGLQRYSTPRNSICSAVAAGVEPRAKPVDAHFDGGMHPLSRPGHLRFAGGGQNRDTFPPISRSPPSLS